MGRRCMMAIIYLLAAVSTVVRASSRGQHPKPPTKHERETFVEHYYQYILSPAVVVIGLILIGPVLYGVYGKLRQRTVPTARRTPDCFRLGISKQSNLRDWTKEVTGTTTGTIRPRVKALFTYPVKSCRGVELAASEVVPTGLKYDRVFTFAQLVSTSKGSGELKESNTTNVSTQWNHQWRFITQRDFPKLALPDIELWVPNPRRRSTESSLDDEGSGQSEETNSPNAEDRRRRRSSVSSSVAANGGCVVIRFPFEPGFNPFGIRTQIVTIRVPLAPTTKRAQARKYTVEPLSIWKDRASAINVSNEIRPDDLAKLKDFLGVSNPLGLFRVDDRNQRVVTRSLPKDRPGEKFKVGFGDAFPLHMLSLSSIQALNDILPSKEKAKARLDPLRFRANIYVSDSQPYDEDTWKRITAGRCIRKSSNGEVVEETEGDYHVACRTARCKLPNVDQTTGIQHPNEPYSTLARTRKVDEGAYPHPCLGMQMIPLFSQGLLKVGDEITVAQTGEHYYEKMFS